MSNRETYPAAQSPLQGDISGPAGASLVTVVGFQMVPASPQTPVDQNVWMYIAADSEWVPTAIPNLSCLAQNFVIQWSCGYYPAGISYLGEGTLAIGDGTDGDASGGLALTGLLLYNGPYLTTVRSGALVNWTLTLPTTAGTVGQVLATDGHGGTYWTDVFLEAV